MGPVHLAWGFAAAPAIATRNPCEIATSVSDRHGSVRAEGAPYSMSDLAIGEPEA